MPQRLPLYDEQKNVITFLNVPDGATTEQIQQAGAAAMRLYREGKLQPNPMTPNVMGPSGLVDLGVNAAVKAVPAAALSAALPGLAPGAGAAALAARMGLAGAGALVGNEVTAQAMDGRSPSNLERGASFAMGGAMQGLAEGFHALLKPLAFSAQEADDLARATTRADAIPGEITAALPGAPATQRGAGNAIKQQAPVALGETRGFKNRYYDLAATRAEKLGLKMPAIGNPISVAADDTLRALDSAGLDDGQKAKVANILEAIAARSKGGATLAQATPTPITYAELDGWKRDLTEVLPTAPRRGMSKSFGTGSLERLFGKVDDAMTTMAKGTPVEPMLKKADSYLMNRYVPVREAVKNLSRDTLQPSNVVDVFAADRQGDATLHLLGKGNVPGVLPVETANKIRQATFRDVVEQKGVEGLRDWWKQLNPRTRASLAGPARGTVEPLMAELEKVLDVRATLGPRVAGRASSATQGAVTGAAASLTTAIPALMRGDIQGGLTSLLVGGGGGAIIGKMLTSQGASKAALRMLRATPMTKAAARFATQWLGEVGLHVMTEPTDDRVAVTP